MTDSVVPANSMGDSAAAGNGGNIAKYDPLLIAGVMKRGRKLRDIIGNPKKKKKK